MIAIESSFIKQIPEGIFIVYITALEKAVSLINNAARAFDQKDMEKVYAALKPLNSKRPFAEIVKIINTMLNVNAETCKENLHCIACWRIAIFDLYTITMHSLQQKHLPIFENISDLDLKCDAIPYLYDSFKPHQEIDLLINKWEYTWILLENIICEDNNEPVKNDNKRARSPIEKPFHEIFNAWAKLYEPNPPEAMREKRRRIYRHFTKYLKKINNDQFPREKLEDSRFSHVQNYNYIMVMFLMLAEGCELPEIFQKFCDMVKERYFSKSSESGWNLFEIPHFFALLFLLSKDFYNTTPAYFGSKKQITDLEEQGVIFNDTSPKKGYYFEE